MSRDYNPRRYRTRTRRDTAFPEMKAWADRVTREAEERRKAEEQAKEADGDDS